SLPAVGQGALGIECRADDDETRAVLQRLHDGPTAVCVAAERGVLIALGGDCKTPMAAYAERLGDTLRLRAFVARSDGTDLRKAERTWPWPATEAVADGHGRSLAATLAG
ncbi:MAG TPA: hydroxymethylbilane synthase, partial [Polyangiaceae bacterium]